MLRSSLRPLAQAARSTTSRAYSTSRTTSISRGAVIASVTLAIGALAWQAPPVRELHADGKKDFRESLPDAAKNTNVRESVLDQKSLKESIHKREQPKSDDLIEMKAAEASKPAEGAFNEETGEINWDCPCLGGMADGPCGEDFKAAFSCFVYSDKEPKGVECVEKFQAMQDCFRAHPDVYGEELDDDDEDVANAPSDDPRPPAHKKGPPAPPNKEPPKDEDGNKLAHR